MMINTFIMLQTIALNHVEIGKNPQRISQIKPFINKYNWKGIIIDQKKITEKTSRKIVQQLLLICYMLKKLNIYNTSISKYNLNCENQIIILMIPNGEGWHYFAVKKIICIIKRNNVKTQVFKIVFIFSEQKTNLTHIRKCKKIKIFEVFQYFLKTPRY